MAQLKPIKMSLPVALSGTSDALMTAKYYTLQLLFEAEQLKDEVLKREFYSWIQKFDPQKLKIPVDVYLNSFVLANSCIPYLRNDLISSINQVRASYCKSMDFRVPTNANRSSDTASVDINCGVIEADGFLYEDLTDELERQGLSSDELCQSCRSTDIYDVEVKLDSSSVDSMIKLFGLLLNEFLNQKQMLIYGSGVGCFTYGAFLFSKASKIISYEKNDQLCCIQKDIIKKHEMKERVTIFQAGVMPGLLSIIAETDLVIVCDRIQCSYSFDEKATMWKDMRKNMMKGSVLITCTSLKVLLATSNFENFTEWILPHPLVPQLDSDDHPNNFYVYEVQ